MKNKKKVYLAPEIGRKLLELLQICREVEPNNKQLESLITALIEHEVTQEQLEQMAVIVKQAQGKLQKTVDQAHKKQEQLFQTYGAELEKTEEIVDQFETTLKGFKTV